MNIKPLADRVLVLPAPAEEKQSVELSFPIQQKRNLSKVRLLLLVTVRKMRRWS